jgi:hypothetical protein
MTIIEWDILNMPSPWLTQDNIRSSIGQFL